jgi:hypothetical protein
MLSQATFITLFVADVAITAYAGSKTYQGYPDSWEPLVAGILIGSAMLAWGRIKRNNPTST